MVTSEAAKAVMRANQALADVYDRAAGRDLTRDEKRLAQRYEGIIDEGLTELLPTTKSE
ncbi:hypothetical protein [Microbacterium sp. SZ1]|uniref:hypothetical protein n=1 Tax=Microbacterium sp. SZ1 TaxID=1849736 RepID=UPI0015CC6D45|nr:hypothetical protein [Microbacterium sp. SZ1]